MTDLLEREAPPAPIEPTTRIKPSEALRIGRLYYPKASVGNWFSGEDAACALGAIHIGLGGNPLQADDASYSRRTLQYLMDWGIERPVISVGCKFDFAVKRGDDGDKVVLDYLEAKGL